MVHNDNTTRSEHVGFGSLFDDSLKEQ